MCLCGLDGESAVQGPPRFLVWRTGQMVVPPEEMKPVGGEAGVEKEGFCQEHAQHGVGAVLMVGECRNE